MRGQVSLEFLILNVGLLALYAALLPGFLSAFNSSLENLNARAAEAIVNQIAWKASEVSLLGEGSELTAEFVSPSEFNLSFQNGEVLSPFAPPRVLSDVANGEILISKGNNLVVFSKTYAGVEIHAK